MFIQSEPGVCTKTKIAENCYVTLWDKWSIRGNENYTLKNFIDSIKKSYNLTVSGVMHGSKSIYLPVMPTHAKRLNEKMVKLIKGVNQLSEKLKSEYVDLYLTYSECDNNENRDQNNLCPPIRYFFS
jgi:ubiquitin-activating enzyme E1-like protein 2